MPTDECTTPYKDTKESVMPTLVPVATIIVLPLCLLLSLALHSYKMEAPSLVITYRLAYTF